jgi:DNA-binding XRE family transcriptional regulator
MINMNLVSLRKRCHMTQEEVAEKINVTRQAIVKWEKGV